MNALELRISRLLRTGVLIAGAIIATGWLWGIAVNDDDLFRFTQYRSAPLTDTIREDLRGGNFPALVVYFGMALLVMLPAVRVLLTGILFLALKERILGWIAIAVFAVLVSSFLLGNQL